MRITRLAALAAAAALLAQPAQADPCGMVPPIWIGAGNLERIGAQKTYIFYDSGSGTESIVLRPGFSGKCPEGKQPEFGMLIPFPSAPTVRKVPDEIFSHIACAIDPREFEIDLRPHPVYLESMTSTMGGAQPKSLSEKPLAVDVVNVLSEEAVGMYQVVVLEAGSANALVGWLKDNDFKYPRGMEPVAQEYVEERWVFVAVKTQVGSAAAATPKPGMTHVDPTVKGADFDGNVQAMGFRFQTDQLVVPMRLSAFNPTTEGELHNVVYLLTDKPMAINNIPQELVRRQVSGEDLYRNLNTPLPVRLIGGKKVEPDKPAKPAQPGGAVKPGGPQIMPFPGGGEAREFTQEWLDSLLIQRDPDSCNGYARDLFGGDLLAARLKRLDHPHEEEEKALLAIAERMQLRGEDLDANHRTALEAMQKPLVDRAMNSLKGMTMTVIDGNFPQEILARENLTFCSYEMPAELNDLAHYDARTGEASKAAEGEVVWGFDYPVLEQPGKRQRPERGRPEIGGALGEPGVQVKKIPTTPKSPSEYIRVFRDRSRALNSANALLAMGDEAFGPLLREAMRGTDQVRRGWSIAVLSEIAASPESKSAQLASSSLQSLHGHQGTPEIVRLWAGAGLITMSRHASGLIRMAPMAKAYPALGRPMLKRLLALTGNDANQQANGLLELIHGLFPANQGGGMMFPGGGFPGFPGGGYEPPPVPALKSQIQQAILGVGPAPLVLVSRQHRNNDIRRLASGYVGAIAKDQAGVDAAVVEGYAFQANAYSVPWRGGALFIPALAWQKEPAQALVKNLMRWMVWVDMRPNPQGDDPHKQIHIALRSLQLAQAAGYTSPGWNEADVKQWLHVWGTAYGKGSLTELLREQPGAFEKHKDVVDKLQ